MPIATLTEAAIGVVTLQIIWNCVIKLRERGPERLVDGKALGPRSLLDDRHRAALVRDVGGRMDRSQRCVE